MEGVLCLLGWAKGLTSLGTGAHTSGDSMGHTLVAARGALGVTGLDVQEAAGGLRNSHHLHPDLGILWGSPGLGETSTRALFLLSPRLWAGCCAPAGAESALSNRSLAEPRQLLSLPG